MTLERTEKKCTDSFMFCGGDPN